MDSKIRIRFAPRHGAVRALSAVTLCCEHLTENFARNTGSVSAPPPLGEAPARSSCRLWRLRRRGGFSRLLDSWARAGGERERAAAVPSPFARCSGPAGHETRKRVEGPGPWMLRRECGTCGVGNRVEVVGRSVLVWGLLQWGRFGWRATYAPTG